MDEHFWIDKKVLITGASGFIGRHLLSRLLMARANVAATELDTPVLMVDNLYKCNLTNYDDVNRVISRFQPEIVFHLAAQPIVDTAFDAPLDTFETNIRGTYNLLETCERVGKNIQHFIHFSTDKVYGESNPEGSVETDRLDGINHPYNASKLCGDILAQSYAQFGHMPITIIRSGNVYGAGDSHWDRLIPYVCKMLATEQPLELRSDGFLYRDYIYIDDVIDALMLVGADDISLPNSFPRIYNLGADHPYPVRDIVLKLFDISGKDENRIIYGHGAEMELSYQHMNYSHIKNELGWIPKVGIDEGLAKTYAAYKDEYGTN